MKKNIPYLENDNLALNFLGTKPFNHLSVGAFESFAIKNGLPIRLVVNIVKETIEQFEVVWNASEELPMNDHLRKAISNHLDSLPLWKKRQG